VGSGRAGEVVHGNAGWVLGFWVDVNLVVRGQKLYVIDGYLFI
jgi:hypothetical protein